MGSIYQRSGTGPWWIAYVGLDGKQHCESSRNRSAGIKGTHADATRLVNLREGKIAEGVAVTPQTSRLTFEDAVAAVLRDHDINAAAQKRTSSRTESIYRRYHIVAEADIHEAGARLDASTDARASTTKVLRFAKAQKRRARRTRKIA